MRTKAAEQRTRRQLERLGFSARLQSDVRQTGDKVQITGGAGGGLAVGAGQDDAGASCEMRGGAR